MDLKIIDIKNGSDLQTERVLLKASADCNVGDYILFDTTYDEKGAVSNEWRHVFLFPKKEIEKGDIVRVYTRAGKAKTITATATTPTNHDFYWGLGEPIWNNEGDCAHLFEIAEKAPPFCVGKAK